MESAGPEAVGTIFMLVCMVFMGVAVIINVAGFAFWIWMLIDCATNEPKRPDNQTVVWILVIVLASWIGALIFYFVRRSNRPVLSQYPMGAQKPMGTQKPQF